MEARAAFSCCLSNEIQSNRVDHMYQEPMHLARVLQDEKHCHADVRCGRIEKQKQIFVSSVSKRCVGRSPKF